MKVFVFIDKPNERGIHVYLQAVLLGQAQAATFSVMLPLPPPSTSQLWLTSPGMAPDSVVAHPQACQGLLAWQGRVSKSNHILHSECWN